MYKLIAIDIDGTLINSYGKISEENKKAIKNAIDSGTEVVLTSGRTVQSILPIAEEIGTNNYLIAGNGALVWNIKNKKNIYGQYLSKNKIVNIVKKCKENNIFVNVYFEDRIITEALDYSILFYDSENKKLTPDRRINIEIKKDIVSYVKNYDKKDFLKITICEQNKIAFDRIMDYIRNYKDISYLDIKQRTVKKITSKDGEKEIAYYYTEIMNDKVNKWSALEFLIKKLNIKKEDVLTIGDNVNDAEMLKNAKVGVAMGNSYPELKEIANYVVADNNSNGVAEAIIKYNN